MTYTADPNDPYVAIDGDHSLLNEPDIKAVRQPHAFSRSIAEEVIAIAEDRLILACRLFDPFFEAVKAPAKLKELLPLQFLHECAAIQQSFASVPTTIPMKAGLFFDIGRTKAHARPFHIEHTYFPPSRTPVQTIRARGMIASFSEASMKQQTGGETEMILINGLTGAQILSTIGNSDPIGSASLQGVHVHSLDACEAMSFWGDSYEKTNPFKDFLVHRSRPVGSKRISLGLAAGHPIDGFDL